MQHYRDSVNTHEHADNRDDNLTSTKYATCIVYSARNRGGIERSMKTGSFPAVEESAGTKELVGYFAESPAGSSVLRDTLVADENFAGSIER